MLDRFTNYKLTPENYIPSNTCFTNKQPPKPKYPLVAYNALGDPVGFTWNYGDTIWLEFNTTGYVEYDGEDVGADNGFIEDAETYLTVPVLNRNENTVEKYLTYGDKTFQVLIYDLRYNVVAHCETAAAPTVKVLSDSFYPSSLTKGVYKLELNLIDKNAGTQYTLIPGDECLIYIK